MQPVPEGRFLPVPQASPASRATGTVQLLGKQRLRTAGARIEDQVTKGDTILESRAAAFQHGRSVERMVCEGLSVTRSAAITALKDRKFGGGCRESTTQSPFAPTSCNFAIWPSLAKGNVLRSDRANCQDLSTF